MPTRSRTTRRLRGTRVGTRSNARYLASRYRPRGKKLSRRKWQAAARRQVAVPRNYSTAKTQETVFPTGATVLQNALSVTPLLNGISKGTDINQRLRDSIVISGIKIDAAFQNIDTRRLMINWAVIHPKQNQLVTNTQKGFFRDFQDERSWDANSATKTGLSWSQAKINTDDFVILKRGKFMLAPGNVATGTGANPGTWNVKDSEKEISHWLKLNRTFTYDTTDQTPVINDPIYFVTWPAWPSAQAGSNLGEGMRYKLRAIVYFREPKTG